MQIVHPSEIANISTRFPLTVDRFNSRILLLNTGEHLTEHRLVEHLLPTGSFAHRKQVEAEVAAIFDVLAALAERLKEKAA